ncbi:hypothetical protein [Streptomyces sp. NPDC058613]|uniref:hypothetical protein n=1 Tax=unclassified Streptomyces TaxID=2593676 RepID=UPI003664266E
MAAGDRHGPGAVHFDRDVRGGVPHQVLERVAQAGAVEGGRRVAPGAESAGLGEGPRAVLAVRGVPAAARRRPASCPPR